MPHLITNITPRPAEDEYLSPMNQFSTNSRISSASSSRRNSLTSVNGAGRRQSNTVSDAYATLMAKTSVGEEEEDALMHQQNGDRARVNGTANGVSNGLNGYYNGASKSRKSYYDNQDGDSSNGSVRERVLRESPVIAELRTNVIVKDEFTLVTDLSFNLAKRYNRADSAVMVKIDHSACLALGGTFDPCYILTVTAVASQMGPTMNKRNAAVIQSFMADILSVPPERGILKFQSMPEENLAINGTTLLGDIERQEKQGGYETRRQFTNGSRRSMPSIRKASPPKLDLDFNLSPLSQESQSVADSLGSFRTDDLSKRSRANGLPASSAGPHHPPKGVFELPTFENEPQRPSTSYTSSAASLQNHSSTGAWRSNSMRADISSAFGRLPNGRPKTLSGDEFKNGSLSHSTAPQLPQLNLGTSASSRSGRQPPFLQNDPNNPNLGLYSSSDRRHSQNGASTAGGPQLTTIADLKQHSAPFVPLAPNGTNGTAGVASANGHRRRSSVSATPQIPKAPPVPSDAMSVKSQRVGKRKSFLSAFRRGSAAATATAGGK